MIICHCRAVSDRTVREHVAVGASDLQAVAEWCGAGAAAAAAARRWPACWPMRYGHRRSPYSSRMRDSAAVRGKPEIVELLNDVLTLELTAINQYFAHLKLQEHWGYRRGWPRSTARSRSTRCATPSR